jgi:adenylosuccinate lyase
MGWSILGELLLELVAKGITREEAYRWVQRNAMRVWDEGGTFKDKVLGDADIVKLCGKKDIEKVFRFDTAAEECGSNF